MISKECSQILDYSKKILNREITLTDTVKLDKLVCERTVETPWVASKLSTMPGGKILDVGFTFASLDYLGLLLEARKKGLSISAIDIINPERVKNRYPREWLGDIMKIDFTKGDIRTSQLKNDYYDAILCISTIEHIGFDEEKREEGKSSFNRDPNPNKVSMKRDTDINKLVLSRFADILKSGGTLLISVPMGKGGAVLLRDSLGFYCSQWEYEEQSWSQITNDERFNLIEEHFYKFENNLQWKKVDSPKELLGCSSTLCETAAGCALAMLKRK